MKIEIIGDYNSVSTGHRIIERIFEKYENPEEDFDFLKGWEYWLSLDYPQHSFKITPCVSNQDILNTLMISISKNQSDFYIIQTTNWYMSFFGHIDYDMISMKHNNTLEYEVPAPGSFVGKRYVHSTRPYFPGLILNTQPFSEANEKGSLDRLLHTLSNGSLFPQIYDVWDPSIASSHLDQAFYDTVGSDKEKMASLYYDLTRIIIQDHLGSKQKQKEAFGTIVSLYLLSKQYDNIWFMHWEPPLGRPEDFLDLEDTSMAQMCDFRKQTRLDDLGLNSAKLELLDTSKRIHPFSVKDFLILNNRNEIEKNLDDRGFIKEDLHAIIYNEYIKSNDTLMEILANG